MDYVPKKADKKAKQASLPTGAGVLLGVGRSRAWGLAPGVFTYPWKATVPEGRPGS